ncbi:ankyrin repeat domain-containing protein 39-like [Liolophura sinensis]|uniref:ankyrin repeat domain-containing protein 39-like n=1 Tax=Liolophura sinensis TaxID=3198878 RepID=UPI003158306B
MTNCGHSHDCGGHTPLSVTQTMDEMEFERGIWSAAMNGETHEVEKHLKRGVCVNKEDSYGFTALHYSVRNGHMEVSRVLLHYGANSNSQTRAGKVTPVHRAAYKGHLDLLKLLLKHGAKPEMVDADQKNALHKAAENGHSPVVNYLVTSYSHLVGCHDNQGKTPKDYISERFPNLLHLFEAVKHNR